MYEKVRGRGAKGFGAVKIWRKWFFIGFLIYVTCWQSVDMGTYGKPVLQNNPILLQRLEISEETVLKPGAVQSIAIALPEAEVKDTAKGVSEKEADVANGMDSIWNAPKKELPAAKTEQSGNGKLGADGQDMASAKEKVAFLTFDDGPSPKVTPQILDILKKNDIKATFFLIGELVQYYPDIVKREVAEGHLIANHTYSHEYKRIYSHPQALLKDMEKGEDALESTLHIPFPSNVMRFPGGSFGKKLHSFREAVQQAGYVYYDWNALNGDAEGKNISEDALKARVKETVGKKKSIILLMHDANSKQNTVNTLQWSIDYLKQRGYTFDTLDHYQNQK